MRAFIETFGSWFGALSAIFLFVVLLVLFGMWVFSHNAPAKDSTR